MNDPTADAAEAPSLPPVPRPRTHRVCRRSWGEMSVRVWLVLAGVVLLVTVYFTVTRVSEAMDDRWLVQHGTAVRAKVETAMGVPVPKRLPRNEPIDTTLSFTLPDGKRHEIAARLEAKPGAFVQPGTELPIKVDPNAPDRWTERTEPQSWKAELTVVGMLLPLLVLLIGAALWKRMGVLRIWRNEPLAAGTVVEVRHTAVAPRSRVVRFTLRDSADRRVWAALLPTSAGIPARDETLWLICPPNNPGRAIPAKTYHEG